MYSNSTNKKNRPSTSYLVRPRLGPSRSIYSSKPIMSAFSQDKKKKSKKQSGGKMDYRRRPDYADTAYREAVGRLRILLAESYTSLKRPMRELDSAGEETDNQSVISAISRASRATRPYYHYLSTLPKRYYYPSLRPTSIITTEADKNQTAPKYETSPAPPELMSFIEKQEEYIEQLEKESRFCREELSSLLGKVKDVISENENLHEKQKSNLMKSVFNHLETETETETDLDLIQKSSHSPRKSKKVLEGPTIVFESRISELEAQLTQARIDLKKALEENENYKKRVADGSILEGYGFEHYKKQVESLQREKEIMQETVSKLQSALSKFKDKENDTCDQVKRSLDAAEQAHYEKNAAELEIRRLKDELDRQHAKLRDAITDQSRRIADERTAVERRYTQQIEQLTTELGVQWETTNKLQLELDKQRRENSDLRREIAQKQALLDGMKKDMQNKIMSLQSDIGVNGAEKSALEQQIANLQMAHERNERQAKQEVTRLQAEMQSLRQRLDRADADLIHSRRENIRLNEQVASLEKELKLNSAMNEEKNKQSSGEILALPPPKEDKQFSSLLQDMESKHAATVAELEGMIHSQNQLMDKLSLECHTLTQKLEDASARHKEEIRELQTSLNRLNSRLLSQTQITSPKIKAEENYNTISNQRPPQPQESPKKVEPEQPRQLSRTSSRSSVKQEPVLPKRKSQERISPPIYPEENKLNKNTKLQSSQEKIYENPNETKTDKDYGQYARNEPNYMPQDFSEGQEGDQMYQGEMTGYENQYAADPNQQYSTDPNQQYSTDPNQQYGTDPDQQYITDPNQQYTDDPNQQYTDDPNQQYMMDPSQQYSTQGGQEYDQQYMTDPNYPTAQQAYSEDPQQYMDQSGVNYNKDNKQYSDQYKYQ